MKEITKQTYIVFWQHIRKYKLQFWVIIASIGTGSLVSIIIPLFYKRFFDLIAKTGTVGWGETAVALRHLILIVFILNGLLWALFRLASFVNNYFQPRVMSDVANTCFDYLHHHSYGFFANKFVGALVRKVGRLVAAFEYVSDALYWNLLQTAVRIVASLIVIFIGYPVIGFIMLGWIIIYLIINYILALKKLKYDVASAKADSRVTAYLADTITNNSNVKLFTAHTYEGRGFREETNEQFTLTKKSWDFDAKVEAVQFGFMIFLEFLVFYVAIGFWQKGAVSVGDFVLIQTYLIQMFDRLWDVGRTVRQLYRRLADAEEMVEILHTPHQVQDKLGAGELSVPRGELEFKNVRFAYTGVREVVTSFNLTVSSGEKVGLVGPSGAGKTTLVALLLRFYDLTDGSILIDGQDIRNVTQNSLRHNISFVPQDPILFHRTLLDNIRYGRRDATEEEVIAAAKLAHCDEFINRLPDGYGTFVGERGIKLSGGERQRVAIARAILKNAPILVLDEATSSLDSHTENLIQDALINLMKNKTTIVIAHRLSTIMKLDRIVVINQGQVQEIGSHKQLLKKAKGLYKKLWNLQAGGFIA